MKNTLNQHMHNIKPEDQENVKRLLCGELKVNDCENQDLIERMKNQEYVVPEEIDEAKTARYLFNQEMYGAQELELTLLPTNGCNFDCVYCYQKEPYFFMTDEIKRRVLLFIKKHIKDYTGLKIAWFGGEPLLAKDYISEFMAQVKEICKKSKKPLYSNMTTNGYELDGATFEKLIKNHVRNFQITIDGPQEIHNQQRQHKCDNDSWSRIMNNIRYIRDNFQKKTFIIIIRINVSTKLLPYLNDYMDFLYKEFGNDNHFTINYEVIRDWGGDKIGNHKELMDYEENVMAAMDKFTKMGFVMNKGFHQDYRKIAFCAASKVNGLVINYDGTLHKCAMHIVDNTKINQVGFINENGDLDIELHKMAKWVEYSDVLVKCADCKFYPECMGISCPLNLCNNHKEAQCSYYFMKQYEYIMRNKAIYNQVDSL